MDQITDSEQRVNELTKQLDQAKSQLDYSSRVSSIVGFILLVALIYVTRDSGWQVFLGLMIIYFVCDYLITTIRLRKYSARVRCITDEWLRTVLESEKKQADS